MKNECNIIRDILPLYMENMVSNETREFVENHISQCEKCQNELEKLKSDLPFQKEYQDADNAVNMMKKIELDINKKRVFTGALSAIISAVIVILAFAYLTAPEYIPYTEAVDIVSVEEANGTVTLSFTGEYELSQRELGMYDINLYNTLWNKLFNLTKF